MKIDVATDEDIRAVALQMRERDFAEFSAVTPVETREALADLLAARYGGRPDVLCASIDDGPVCIGGTIESRPNVMTLLFFATDKFPDIAIPITRFIRRLFSGYEKAGVHRIEAVSLDDYAQMHRWLRSLGLQDETGPMRNYGKGGETFIQFARVKSVCATGA